MRQKYKARMYDGPYKGREYIVDFFAPQFFIPFYNPDNRKFQKAIYELIDWTHKFGLLIYWFKELKDIPDLTEEKKENEEDGYSSLSEP